MRHQNWYGLKEKKFVKSVFIINQIGYTPSTNLNIQGLNKLVGSMVHMPKINYWPMKTIKAADAPTS